MNGIHDLGGMHGFTLPERDPDEPVFKHEWEKQVFAAAIAFASPWSIDESRFAIESITPGEYLRSPYYGRWLTSFERLLVKYNRVTEEELKSPDGRLRNRAAGNPADAAAILEALKAGDSARRETGKPARFRVGDRVVVKNEHPEWHTRMPRYVRGRRGAIHIDHGIFVFPDSSAKGEGEQPQHCYSVAFSASELWGSSANPKDRVYVDLFDDYLVAAS